MNPLGLSVLLYCFISFSAARPSDVDNLEETSRDSKGDKFFQQFSLPYWAFVPALGVWPDGPTTSMISMLPAEIAKINVNGAQEPKFKYQKHPNTPSINGPSKLRKSASTQRPITKIYLKPSAKAKAGKGGVALSNPISTAIVKRGDTVSIEYLPVADAEVGDGGVAISRPELVIHFVD